ncbi:MAG: hypothetical protein AUJ12_04355 [Alphaproteobacteria bacterium CG1_02_46_17]|nr:MAG: hypothetical protein AUJ12_04355 [Alphaproteobacteria bacterium CG1_02_46_17]
MTKISIEENTRAQLAEFLPRALEKALNSYHRHMNKDVESQGFCFSTFHKDAKVAISHVELLIKLAKWVDQAGEETNLPLISADILALAENDIAAFREQQE